ADPVGTTDLLEYTLTYGNSSRSSSNTQLVFPLPSKTSFVSATGGGTESGGEVIWNLGNLESGAGGESRVTVRVNANEGDLVEVDGAYIAGTDSSFVSHTVFADRVTRVENGKRPNLGIQINPNPVKPNWGMRTHLTVSNPRNTLLSNVELILRYPNWLNRLSNRYVSTGGESNTLTGGCISDGVCEANEFMRWNLGSLRPGGGVTVTFPQYVWENTPAGTLIRFEAEIRVDGVQQMMESRTTRVASDPLFTLAVDEDADPVGTTDLLEYTLTYGNISTNSSDTRLVFPLPSGTSFVSGTGVGTVLGGEVIWDLGNLGSGEGGERRVTVQINAGEGDLLEVNGAYITGTDSSFVPHTVLVDHAVRIEDDRRPSLMMSLNPMPVEPGEQMDVALTVTNSVGSLLSNVELILRYPGWLNRLSYRDVSTGGESNTLTGGCISNGVCETNELMRWNLNTLPPGGDVTVTMPPTVRSDAPEGTRLLFDAEVRVDGVQQLTLSETVFVGTAYDNPSTVFVAVAVPGDIDDNDEVNIADAIAALQIVAGLQPTVTINRDADVNGDTLIGLPEAIYSLQVAAEAREQ
ncbi:MAG: hypothetical protein ACLFQQ_10425, partial [Desulfococcaceae bacterium]